MWRCGSRNGSKALPLNWSIICYWISMIEKHAINGKEHWIKIDPHPVDRENPNTIPREYFTVSCYQNDPTGGATSGDRILDQDGKTRLFESPVAAISAARKYLEQIAGSDPAASLTPEQKRTASTQQEQKETD